MPSRELDASFTAKLQVGNRVSLPANIVEQNKLEVGQTLSLRIQEVFYSATVSLSFGTVAGL